NKPVKQEILPEWFDKNQQEAPKKQKMTEEEKKAYEEVMRKLGRGDELEAKA
ncbi:DNA replication protein DnaD, partial [Listeria monocytogenes]|nr:DNA replication protein DnaD [Listeria monocytogenes]EKC7115638.1 DNA replication protein DnaD [Listeria monocytogenes]EKZ3701614.1 DNA replication protein DnaD [Listeria monocytogenes]